MILPWDNLRPPRRRSHWQKLVGNIFMIRRKKQTIYISSLCCKHLVFRSSLSSSLRVRFNMERDPKDKVVVVTGGARGIGYEIADQFLKNGAKTLIILDIIEDIGVNAVKTLNDTYGKGKAIFIKCDVTKDLDKVSEDILQKHQVDVLVNNAGILNEDLPRQTLEINCVALVEWSMKFWEYMRTDKGGRGGTIYNIASIYGYQYNPWLVFYKASKHAVLGFTRSLGHPYNYKKTGVSVIAICPGFTDTVLRAGNVWEWHKEDINKMIQAEVILQTPETIAKAVVVTYKFAETGTVWTKENNEPIKLAPLNALDET